MALPTYWREAASVILVGRVSPPRGKADSKVLMMKRSEKVQGLLHTHARTHTHTHTHAQFRFSGVRVNLQMYFLSRCLSCLVRLSFREEQSVRETIQ